MAKRWPGPRAAVAILLLALVAAPIARDALASLDSHGCCAEGAVRTEAPAPCQYVAPLGCCAQLGVPATPVSDELRASPAAAALVAFAPLPPRPPVLAFANARSGHGPPQASLVRTTVLRL